MRKVSHLNSLQAIEAAVRCGSLKAAAAELGVTTAGISQRITFLEDYLGLPLVQRGRNEITPTKALRPALRRLGAAFRQLEGVFDDLQCHMPGSFSVEADPDFTEFWLLPRISLYRQQRPKLDIRVRPPGQFPEAASSDFRIAFAERREEGGAELLFHDYLFPACSPTVAARMRLAHPRNSLENLKLFQTDYYRRDPEAMSWPSWLAEAGARRAGAARRLETRSYGDAVAAAAAQRGVAMLGGAFVMPELQRGTLASPFGSGAGAWTGYAFQLWSHPDVTRRPHAARFKDWLLAKAAETRVALMDFAEPDADGDSPQRLRRAASSK